MSKTQALIYGFMALPLAFAGLPLYIHAPDYYTTEVGLSLASLGALLLFLRIIDAVQDPIIGKLSDTYKQHRKAIILSSLLLMLISFLGLFHPIQSIWWFALMMLIATTTFSILSINLNAIGSLWKGEKSKIVAIRESFGVLGLFTAVILPSVLMLTFSKPQSFEFFSYILIVLGVMATIGFIFLPLHKLTEAPTTRETETIWPIKFLVMYGISALGSAFAAVLVLFYIRDYLNLENYTGAFLALYFGAALVSMPFWVKISHQREEKSLAMAILGACIIFAFAMLLQTESLIGYAVICIGTGFMLGGELVLVPTILAKKVQGHTASRVFAAMSFVNKLALAIASFIAFSLLETVGFIAAQANTTEALFSLHLLYTAVPVILKGIAFTLYKKGNFYE